MIEEQLVIFLHTLGHNKRNHKIHYYIWAQILMTGHCNCDSHPSTIDIIINWLPSDGRQIFLLQIMTERGSITSVMDRTIVTWKKEGERVHLHAISIMTIDHCNYDTLIFQSAITTLMVL